MATALTDTDTVARRNGNRARLDPEEVTAKLEGLSAEEAIGWAIETFHPSLYFACSFQKTTSVTIDIAQRIDPDTRFFYLDTDVLFEETYETRDALAERYGIEFERYAGISLDEQAKLYGDELWGAPARRLLRDPQGRADARGALGPSTAGSRASAARTPRPAPEPRSSAGTSASACGS